MRASNLQSSVAWICSLAAAWMLAGCSAPVLQSMATGMATASLMEQQRDRMEQQSQIQAESDTQVPKEVETAQGYLQLIVQMQRQELWFASLAHLDAYEARWSSSDESRLLRADALRHAGQHEESAHIYNQLLQGQQAAKAHHGLGLLSAARGAYGQAIESFEHARRLAPTDALLLNDLALAQLYMGRHEQARIPLMQASQLLPQQRRIQSNVAVYLLLHDSDEVAQAWMHQHQMNAEQREQVAKVAQQVAKAATELATVKEVPVAAVVPEEPVSTTVLTAASPTPVPVAAVSEIALPAPTHSIPALAPITATVTSAVSAPWMTEISRNGMHP